MGKERGPGMKGKKVKNGRGRTRRQEKIERTSDENIKEI